MNKKQFKKFLISIFFLLSLNYPANAAEEVAFVSGIFRRNVSVKDIELISQGKNIKGILEDLSKIGNEEPDKISEILNQKIELPIDLASKLMYTKIGGVFIKRIAKIIYPLKVQKESVSIPAIRAAVINGLIEGKGEINLILFLKSYPNKVIAVNVPELFQVINKVESISDLVKFFSNSPLEGLKNGTMKT